MSKEDGDSMPSDDMPAEAAKSEVSAEWLMEAEKRSAEYDAGRMPASPWKEVRERARKEAGLDV